MIAEAIISLEESEILPEETKRRKGKETDERFLVFGFEGMSFSSIFLDSSMVEHTAVNRGVVGSSPTRGVYIKAPWSSG